MFIFRNISKLLFPLTYIDDDGKGGSDDWKSGLPEDVQSWEEVQNSDSVEKFWGQMTNMRSHLGQSIRIPGQDAGDEDWKTFNQKLLDKVPTLMPKPDTSDSDKMTDVYKAMGMPDKAEDYRKPNDLKHINDDMLKGFQEQAYSLNLNNAQFETMVKKIDADLETQNTTKSSALEDATQQLKQNWGAAYDNNYSAVLKYLQDTNAPKSLQEDAVNKTLAPDVANWVMEQYKVVAGEGASSAGDRSSADVMTPDEAKIQISEMLKNKEHAYFNQRDPAHPQALKRMITLQKLANAG